MSISFSGLASGLDTDAWISALLDAKKASWVKPLEDQKTTLNYQKTALNSVKSTYSSLLSATQTFTDSKFGVEKDIFSSNSVSVSDSKKISATVTNSTPRQNVSMQVLQLASPTKVTSAFSVASAIDENTLVGSIASGSISEGKMSFYVDGKRFSVDISKEDTLGDIAEKIKSTAVDENGESLVNVQFEDGKFSISSVSGDSKIRVGSNSDTSNFMSALALKSNEDGTVSSAYSISSLDLTKPLTSVESGFYTYDENGEKVPAIKEGTFTIGSAEITVTEKTTMNELISRINSAQGANANAFYDSVQNKLVITSKQDGAFNVNIEGGTSNITDILGLTQNGDIIPETQVLGQNAKVIINGSEIETYSNTITSEVSGIAGLTIDLKSVTEEGEKIDITVGQNTDSIVSEIETLVKAINEMITTSDKATASGAALQYDNSINSLRSDVRVSLTTAAEGSDVYKTLASIGITTGKVGASIDADTNKFQIDKDKLVEALKNDPQAVKDLLIGNKEEGITGIVQKVQDVINDALDSEHGFFTNRENTLTSQISNITARIETKTSQLTSYQERLQLQFQNMEKQISKLQSQQSQMSSVLGL